MKKNVKKIKKKCLSKKNKIINSIMFKFIFLVIINFIYNNFIIKKLRIKNFIFIIIFYQL